jgi:hypothetical protein
MTLQTSGAISIKDIRNEFAPSAAVYDLSAYYRNGLFVPDTTANAGIPTSGTISIGDFYGGDSTPAGPPGGGGGGEGFP